MKKLCPRCIKNKDIDDFKYAPPGSPYVEISKFCNECVFCKKCKKFRRMNDFRDSTLEWGYGRICNFCKKNTQYLWRYKFPNAE